MTTTGDRYAATAGLTTTEIAKRIRADLKAAQRDGELDATLRFSVRTAYFSGGSEISVTVKNYTGTLRDLDEYGRRRWAPQARKVAGTVRGIVDAYNRDDSDVMASRSASIVSHSGDLSLVGFADCSNRRFYSHVGFEQLPGVTVP